MVAQAEMLENMPPEQLKAMAPHLGDIDPSQMKAMSAMMKNMDPSTMKNMAKMAQQMGKPREGHANTVSHHLLHNTTHSRCSPVSICRIIAHSPLHMQPHNRHVYFLAA